jgi:hypothetical protein
VEHPGSLPGCDVCGATAFSAFAFDGGERRWSLCDVCRTHAALLLEDDALVECGFLALSPVEVTPCDMCLARTRSIVVRAPDDRHAGFCRDCLSGLLSILTHVAQPAICDSCGGDAAGGLTRWSRSTPFTSCHPCTAAARHEAEESPRVAACLNCGKTDLLTAWWGAQCGVCAACLPPE